MYSPFGMGSYFRILECQEDTLASHMRNLTISKEPPCNCIVKSAAVVHSSTKNVSYK